MQLVPSVVSEPGSAASGFEVETRDKTGCGSQQAIVVILYCLQIKILQWIVKS